MTLRRAVALSLLGIALAGRVEGQAGGAYSVRWNSLDGGGQSAATGGVYRVGGTAGQPDAARLTGGLYTVTGGFWTPLINGAVDVSSTDPVPSVFAARPATPNPFRTTTSMAFDLPAARHVELALYGIEGRVLRRLVSANLPAGRHLAIWDGRDEHGHVVASGIYFVHLRAGEFSSTLRVVRID